ncbi:cobalt/nickel transport system permease [Thermosulfidibacter takaii ABI70S6]|uniref:Cobalt/nickel transport system permease n=1 Tax=Thermosulfidibacter takaii (strain DSM 17441 / JCM 13301 / NBRC 103674 / ABI70S6) TaxID=1298851 RepID=A0A0S3QUD7_THET7|nr:PDGLE domain-containing protein [Thermosulfidibacter takaii]BAT71934.1 cobalt/nickel transport system permease [Thermosulfidibacter takaii ABI70S6]
MAKKEYMWGVFIAILLALLSPLASSYPDGLEKVAERLGFISRAKDAPFKIMPDYIFPGIRNETLATILAGVTGVLIVLILSIIATRLLVRRNAAQFHR